MAGIVRCGDSWLAGVGGRSAEEAIRQIGGTESLRRVFSAPCLCQKPRANKSNLTPFPVLAAGSASTQSKTPDGFELDQTRPALRRSRLAGPHRGRPGPGAHLPKSRPAAERETMTPVPFVLPRRRGRSRWPRSWSRWWCYCTGSDARRIMVRRRADDVHCADGALPAALLQTLHD